MQIRDLGEFRSLDQELLFGDERGNELHFRVVQMKLPAVQVLVHVRIGEKHLGGAAFEDDVEQFRALQFVERLRGENHGGVVLAPRLEGFGDVALNAGVAEEHPGFIDEKCLEGGRDVAIGNHIVGAMQDVEQERFEQLRIAAHLLEVETLEAGKGDGVLGIVEEKSELSAAHPFGEGVGERTRQGIPEHVEGAQRRIERVEIFDLFVQLAVCRRIERAEVVAEKNLEKEREKVEVRLRRRETERVDGEIRRFEPEPQVGPAEKVRQAFETSRPDRR